MKWVARWIWTETELPNRNSFVRFRRSFSWSDGQAKLHITADSRYVLYINGCYLGQGPVRAWPAHWKYDTYDIAPYLVPGENTIAVLVNQYGEGNFQYIPGPPGLLAQLELRDGQVVATDDTWITSPDRAFVNQTPRISVQEAFEEQYDARAAEPWTERVFPADGWTPAVIVAQAGDPPHTSLTPRGIPQLTLEPIPPTRIVSVETVTSAPYRWRLHLKPYMDPNDISSNKMVHRAFFFTQIWSETPTVVTLSRPHHFRGALKVNGRALQGDRIELSAGWNQIIGDFSGSTHLQDTVVVMWGPPGLRFASRAAEGGAPWAVVGPFELTEHLKEVVRTASDPVTLTSQPVDETATAELGQRIWDVGLLDDAVIRSPLFQEMAPEHLPADVFLQCYSERPLQTEARVDNPEALLSTNHDWATVHPNSDGDVRVLFDFGREVVGFHHFAVDGPADAILDWHCFEFIQPDGRLNFAERMNNTLRYVTRAGCQTYQSYVRRGFQYAYLTIRNLKEPLRIRFVEVLFNTYPQSRRGSFACSVAQLDRIWEVGAHSLRCCAEDTYVDCPTYEQTHWVGDARNEALIDWVINGDARLWYRCLEQTGQSLDRSPLTESHVPSAWQNILPAWSFLWMRSCREYHLWTGDTDGSLKLLDFVRRNVDGIRKHLNDDSLFDIRAWNMFDWAAMDTPGSGVITHQNCFAVLALRECAELATWLGAAEGAEWLQLADTIASAINRHMWNDERQAYTDCLRDGVHSQVFSQQTQTVAFMSGVATGERARVCRRHMQDPPEGFVKAGSPFFEFFLLEALAQEGQDQEFLETIVRDWGFMVDMGATTFWEMWSKKGGRLTRSHCHGWSAAPTFFLSTHVLGVHPLEPGCSRVDITPHPGSLAWCRGTVPVPQGDIRIQWENRPAEPFQLRIQAPPGVELDIRPPRAEAEVTVNGRTWGHVR